MNNLKLKKIIKHCNKCGPVDNLSVIYNAICLYCGRKVIDHEEVRKCKHTTLSWEIANRIRQASCIGYKITLDNGKTYNLFSNPRGIGKASDYKFIMKKVKK
jgi:hypothetical protein